METKGERSQLLQSLKHKAHICILEESDLKQARLQDVVYTTPKDSKSP